MDNSSDKGYDSDLDEKFSGSGDENTGNGQEVEADGVFFFDEDVDWQKIKRRSFDIEDDKMEAPVTRSERFSNYEELVPMGRHRRSGNEKVHPRELKTAWGQMRAAPKSSPPVPIPGKENYQPCWDDSFEFNQRFGMYRNQNQRDTSNHHQNVDPRCQKPDGPPSFHPSH
ncbi:unnamed protein product, partial [Mesorhabditis spiculigera]